MFINTGDLATVNSSNATVTVSDTPMEGVKVNESKDCPHCGRCPTCGRGGHQTTPYTPWYPSPWWYYYPGYTIYCEHDQGANSHV